MESWRKHMPQGMRLKSDGFTSDLYNKSSVPGLFFIGLAAANRLGPLLRFALGAGFASRRLSAHLNRIVRQRAPQGAAQPVTQ